MSRQPKILTAAIALAACTASLLVGCGDDDKDATNGSTVEEVRSSTIEAGAEPTDAGFCEAYVDITIAMAGEPNPAIIEENLATVEGTAPEEVADQAAVMTEAVSAVLASGGQDFSPLGSPEFAEAQATVDPYVFENCEFDSTIETTGLDYSFEGLPETIEAGRIAVLFTNEGAEAHEIAIIRRNDGVTDPFEDLMALPEEEAMEKVTFIGGAFASTKGSKALLVNDLEPGDYMAVCFIPSGSVASGDGEMTEGTGDPHFVHGMQQEFTVS